MTFFLTKKIVSFFKFCIFSEKIKKWENHWFESILLKNNKNQNKKSNLISEKIKKSENHEIDFNHWLNQNLIGIKFDSADHCLQVSPLDSFWHLDFGNHWQELLNPILASTLNLKPKINTFYENRLISLRCVLYNFYRNMK